MKIALHFIILNHHWGGPFCHPPLQNLNFRALNGERDPWDLLTFPKYILGPLWVNKFYFWFIENNNNSVFQILKLALLPLGGGAFLSPDMRIAASTASILEEPYWSIEEPNPLMAEQSEAKHCGMNLNEATSLSQPQWGCSLRLPHCDCLLRLPHCGLIQCIPEKRGIKEIQLLSSIKYL